MENKIDIQREMLNEVVKSVIKRIKELQRQLAIEQEDKRCFGSYEDCGEFYREQVTKTEAAIAELITQKISFEKWRKKLQYEELPA